MKDSSWVLFIRIKVCLFGLSGTHLHQEADSGESFLLPKTNQADFWGSIRGSCAEETGNSDRNPEFSSMCYAYLNSSHDAAFCFSEQRTGRTAPSVNITWDGVKLKTLSQEILILDGSQAPFNLETNWSGTRFELRKRISIEMCSNSSTEFWTNSTHIRLLCEWAFG